MRRTVAQATLILVLISAIGVVTFQTYANQHMAKFEVTPVQIPKHFEPVQWGKDGWIYGVMGTKFLRYQPETGDWKILLPHVWSALADPAGRFVAFIDEKGLQYVNIETGGKVTSINSEKDLQIHLWSPDGRRLLYSQVEEWSSAYFIYDLETDSSQPYNFTNATNFLSKPVYWRDSAQHELVFSLRSNRSRTGEQEYRSGGYRSEFYLANLKGLFKPLVEVKDGEYLLVDEISTDGDKLYYHYFGQEGKIYECDLSTGQTRLAWEFEQAKKVRISPELQLAVVEKEKLELIDLKQNTTIHTFTFEYNRVIWSADHQRALVYPSKDSAVTTGYLIRLQQ